MDFPLPLIAADIVMDDLEKNCIDSFLFQVLFYFRYVNDLLTTLPVNEIDSIKKSFNSYYHKIQFTIEVESENKVCFLDVLVLETEKT